MIFLGYVDFGANLSLPFTYSGRFYTSSFNFLKILTWVCKKAYSSITRFYLFDFYESFSRPGDCTSPSSAWPAGSWHDSKINHVNNNRVREASVVPLIFLRTSSMSFGEQIRQEYVGWHPAGAISPSRPHSAGKCTLLKGLDLESRSCEIVLVLVRRALQCDMHSSFRLLENMSFKHPKNIYIALVLKKHGRASPKNHVPSFGLDDSRYTCIMCPGALYII